MFTHKTIIICVFILLKVFGTYSENNVNKNEHENVSNIKKREVVIDSVSELSVFYSVTDNHTLTNMMPRPWIKPGQMLRLPFIGEPCACSGLQCGCCAGIKITQFNIDRKVCANITYDPYLFAIVLDVTLDGTNNVVHTVISAKNPPPICIPVPLGAIPISGVDFCIKLFDIFTPGVRNINICMDWLLRILSNPVLILHFDCVRIGADGIVLVKPESSTLASPIEEISEGPVQVNGDVYDEVIEGENNSTSLNLNSSQILSENGLNINSTTVNINDFNTTNKNEDLNLMNFTNVTLESINNASKV